MCAVIRSIALGYHGHRHSARARDGARYHPALLLRSCRFCSRRGRIRPRPAYPGCSQAGPRLDALLARPGIGFCSAMQDAPCCIGTFQLLALCCRDIVSGALPGCSRRAPRQRGEQSDGSKPKCQLICSDHGQHSFEAELASADQRPDPAPGKRNATDGGPAAARCGQPSSRRKHAGAARSSRACANGLKAVRTAPDRPRPRHGGAEGAIGAVAG